MKKAILFIYMLSVVCLLPTTSFVSVSAEATPEFDKKSPKAKGIILSFRRWPGNAEQKRLIKKGSTKGLNKREEFPAFKVWVLEWSEWKSGKTAQQTCAQFSNLSFLKYCEPDYLLGPAQSANERLAPDVRLSEPLTEFSRTETGNVRTCNIIPSQLELQQGKLSDYWAQEMIGSDLAREELKRAPAVGKNLVAVFDFPNQNEHDAKVRNLISGEGRHAVLPAMGDKMTSFDGSLASNYLRHSQGLLNKVSRECQVSHSGSTQTGGGGQQPAPVSGGVAPVEAGQRPSTGSSTQTGGGGQQPAPVSGGVAPVEAGQRPPTGSSAQTGGGGKQPAPVSGGGASVEAGQRSPTGSSAQTGGGGKQPAPVSGGGAQAEAGQRSPTGSSAQTGGGGKQPAPVSGGGAQAEAGGQQVPARDENTQAQQVGGQQPSTGGSTQTRKGTAYPPQEHCCIETTWREASGRSGPYFVAASSMPQWLGESARLELTDEDTGGARHSLSFHGVNKNIKNPVLRVNGVWLVFGQVSAPSRENRNYSFLFASLTLQEWETIRNHSGQAMPVQPVPPRTRTLIRQKYSSFGYNYSQAIRWIQEAQQILYTRLGLTLTEAQLKLNRDLEIKYQSYADRLKTYNLKGKSAAKIQAHKNKIKEYEGYATKRRNRAASLEQSLQTQNQKLSQLIENRRHWEAGTDPSTLK